MSKKCPLIFDEVVKRLLIKLAEIFRGARRIELDLKSVGFAQFLDLACAVL
jgi:hypothetical protein